MHNGHKKHAVADERQSPHQKIQAGNPLIMSGHCDPSEPEIVVAVSAEEGKGAVPGEVNNGGFAQVGRGGEEEFWGGAMCQVTGTEKVKVKWKATVHTWSGAYIAH